MSLSPTSAPRRRSADRGFTLVEIMIVVVIIGLLAAMGVPAMKASRVKSIATRTANDMKKVGEAFETMIFENPNLPNGIYNQNGDGTVPAGFATADLPAIIYRRPINPNSVLSFDLRESQAAANEGVVVLTSVAGPLDADVMLRIDQILDDGNLTTGSVLRVSDSQMKFRTYRD